MKKYFSLMIVAVVALSLGLGVGTANAAWTVPGSGLQTALVTADSSKLSPVAALANVAYTLGVSEGLAAGDTIVITLTGGAKFAAVPTLTPSAGDLGNGLLPTNPLSGGAIGSTSATWRVIVGVPAAPVPSTLTLNSAAAIFDLTDIVAGANVDFQLALYTGTGTQIGTTQSHRTTIGNYVFTGAAAETMALTPRTDIADVSASTGAYLKFTGDTLVGSTFVVQTLTNDSGAFTLPVANNISANKILITLAGNFSGIKRVAGTGITGSDSTGVITGGTAGFFLINTAKTHAYAVNTLLLGAGFPLTIAPVFTIDGTTAQAARSFTSTVQVLEDLAIWDAHTAQSATTLYTITRNGVSFVTNAVGPLNVIKITDRSGALPVAGGNIIITAWDAAGNSIPEDAGVTPLLLLSNGTTSITGADIAARFSTGTPMKYEFAVESANAVGTSVKNTANGVSVTTYTNNNGSI